VEHLVERTVTENPSWGYKRLVGALDNLSHEVVAPPFGNYVNYRAVVLAM
jgi:hypothetical protein